MFPHMYKVRPGKVQQVKESGMAADCQRQRGENWRRNSGGGSSFQQNPPAIPAPPQDPQDNLTRKPSLPSKEPERMGSTDQIQFIENDSLKTRSSPSPVLSRTRIRSRGQPEPYCENALQEHSYPPPGRRSRARPSEGQIATIENGESESSDHPRMRTRSRSRISEDRSRFSANEVCPSSASDVSAASTTRARTRNRQEDEIVNPVPAVENTFPPPGRVRSRSRPSEELQNDVRNSVGQESTTFTPRIRTRSRSRANEMNQIDTNNTINNESDQNHNDNSQPAYGRMRSRSRPSEDIQKDIPVVENSYPASFRTRSRSRNSRGEEEHRPIERLQSPPTVEQNMSLPPPGRRQREQETESTKNDANIEITETIPLRSRERNRNTQNVENQESDNASQAQIVPERSRSRNNEITGENNTETSAPDNQLVSPPVQTVTIRLRKRQRKQEPEETVKIPQEITNGNAESQLKTQTNSQEPENEESKPEETATVTIRRRPRPSIPEENLVKEKPEEEKEKKESEENKIEEEQSFSQESESPEIQATQNDQPKQEENKKPVVRDVFFPETMKSEIIVRKRSSSPAPVMKQDTSPFARRRDQNEENTNSSSPITNSKQDISPVARRRTEQNEERRNSLSPVTISSKQDVSPIARRRSEQIEERRNSSSPAPTSLKHDASPLPRRSEQNEHKHSPSPVPPKDDTESPRSTRRSQLSLERDNEKSIFLATKERSSLDEDKVELHDDVELMEEETTENEETKEEEPPQSQEETEEEEEEDPFAKATRLWLLSKNENSEILEKVLPEIDSSSCSKNKIPSERDVELLDDFINKEEAKPQMIEEWNDDFKEEEPKNFTSFTSIKLKSRPPKSPPDKKKSGRVISKDESSQIPSAPPPPPPPPGPKKSKSGIPRPPPPPSSAPLSEKDLRVKKAREKMVDRIKRAARSRPDWKSVMKDIEGGAKLRKVSSSDKLDRSNPILPKSRGKGGKFFYDSEKPVVQNQLLGEIQRGVRLRHVKTNDRSKPDFAKLGLRKLRRQLTVEEKKSIQSNAPDALPSSSDEEEDIDQMRDDLASTKTQLAEEIKKNKKLETEQKILQIDLQSLQSEVKKLKRKLKEAGIHEAKPLTNGEAEALAPKLSKSMSKLRMMEVEEDLDFSELDTIEKDIQLLNDQIEIQKKKAEKAEVKCDELNQKLQVSQTSCDEWEMRSVYFEKKYKTLQKDQGIELPDIDCSGTQTDPIEIGPAKSDSSTGLYTKKSGSRKSFTSVSRMQSFKEEGESDDESSSSSEEDTLSDHQGDEDEDEERDSEEEDEEDLKGSCADLEKREEREFIMWKNRLSHMKDKVKNVRKERNNLRERVKKFFSDMRLERKDYLKLKAELKDLLDQMKEDEDVIEEEDEEEDSEEEEEEIVQEDEAPEWWCEEAPQKPKKLKKRKKKQNENEDEDENITDMSGLEDPQWSDSEQEDSESEEEDENTAIRIKSLKERTKSLEENMNAKRKETYQLKSKIDQCEEMIAEEKRRHARLENELHMLLADI